VECECATNTRSKEAPSSLAEGFNFGDRRGSKARERYQCRLMPTAEQLANLARLFPPTPRRRAELVIVLDDQIVTVPVQMSEAKLDQLRGLFAGKADSEIF
jgi:hypothetical protein